MVEIVSDSSVAKDTRRLPISEYFAAGITEFARLIDECGERNFFRIHARGTDGYVPVTANEENFQRSLVFNQSFRLDRRRNARGRWVFDLQSRPGES